MLLSFVTISLLISMSNEISLVGSAFFHQSENAIQEWNGIRTRHLHHQSGQKFEESMALFFFKK